MSRYSSYSIEDKVKACEDYLNGVRSASEICADMGVPFPKTVRRWAQRYKINGAEVFYPKPRNKSYSSVFKTLVVEEYIDGAGSLDQLCAKYNIYSTKTLYNWISVYNSHMELKDYNPKREVYMAEASRKTTFEERKEIVEYCIQNNLDYKDTAEKYEVSYSQVHKWVQKYNSAGEEGLVDKRGHHKTDEAVDELEKLRRENKYLKRQIEERDMTVELLKKVKEFERRRF